MHWAKWDAALKDPETPRFTMCHLVCDNLIEKAGALHQVYYCLLYKNIKYLLLYYFPILRPFLFRGQNLVLHTVLWVQHI